MSCSARARPGPRAGARLAAQPRSTARGSRARARELARARATARRGARGGRAFDERRGYVDRATARPERPTREGATEARRRARDPELRRHRAPSHDADRKRGAVGRRIRQRFARTRNGDAADPAAARARTQHLRASDSAPRSSSKTIESGSRRSKRCKTSRSEVVGAGQALAQGAVPLRTPSSRAGSRCRAGLGTRRRNRSRSVSASGHDREHRRRRRPSAGAHRGRPCADRVCGCVRGRRGRRRHAVRPRARSCRRGSVARRRARR